MLDLHGDPIALTAALVDIPSESRDEARIADEVEAALRAQTSGFEIIRNGNAVLARTSLGRPSRVLLLSPPSRGRGLKRCVNPRCRHQFPVASLAGAWIETTRLSKL